MNTQKSIFERYVEAVQKTGDYMLAWQFQKDMMRQRLLNDAEIERIAERVMARIRVQLEDEALRELRNLLNDLTQ